MNEPCSECHGRLLRKEISQEFERAGVKVRLSGLKAGFARVVAKSILSRAAPKKSCKQLIAFSLLL